MDADTAAQEPVNLELQSTNKETAAAENCDGDPATYADHKHVQMVHGNIYFDVPWSPQIYFTVRGAENFHIYLWIAKDLSWTTDNYNSSLFFGSSALAWCAVLVYHAFSSRDYREMYMLVGLMLWLAGNFVWMEGEVVRNDDDRVVPETGAIFEAAIAWMLLYYVVLKPPRLLPVSEEVKRKYREAGLHCRFSYFSDWREYEHIHTLAWLGKDYAWVRILPPLWVLCLVPTILIAIDFIWTTWQTKRMVIDCAHYVAQLIWVIGNMAWAMGLVFDADGTLDDDSTFSLWRVSSASRQQCRWWASVLLLSAYAPLGCLYFVWLPLTCMGKIEATPGDKDDQHSAEGQEVSAVVVSALQDSQQAGCDAVI